MDVKIQQFLFGKNHSWAIVGKNIGQALQKQNNSVDFISTDGINEKFVPQGVVPSTLDVNKNYDLQISYTKMPNFARFLKQDLPNKFGIWCYEFGPQIPPDFVKYYKFCDKILAPSKFAKDIFVSSKVPSSHVEVVPHGVNLSEIESAKPYELKTKKSFKFLMVIGQPHSRKRIGDAIESFYKAFTINDDVCLVAKLAITTESYQAHNVDVIKIIKDLNVKYPRHPEMELITDYVENIYSLHKACQVIYTLTYAECFYIPALDGLYCDNIVVAPKYGGHLDFCNNNNSLLIDGKLVKAPLSMQYYTGSPYNAIFEANIDQTVDALRKSYTNYSSLMNLFKKQIDEVKLKYTWDNVATQISNLCEK